MTYRPHGHNPSDDEIARAGFRAFGPARPAFTPTPEDFAKAARDTASGDDVELAEVAGELAKLWPDPLPPWWPWGQWYDDDL